MTQKFTPKQISILTELKERFELFATLAPIHPVFGYQNFYWDELTELSEICSFVVYTPPNPRGNQMYETGSHDIHESILDWTPRRKFAVPKDDIDL